MPLTEESANRKDQRSGRNVSLQHRHFAFIADVMRSERPMPGPEWAQWEDMVKGFASACSRTNPAFDRQRFLTACGCI